MNTLEAEFVYSLIISAFVGGLLGIERELREEVIAGVRTFMLVSILGMLSAYIGLYYLLIAFVAVIFMSLLLGHIKNYKLEDIGITTVVSFLLAFVLGTMVGYGYYLQAVASSVIITTILVSKRFFIELSKTLTHAEIMNAMEFGMLVFIIYPLLPDKMYFDVINPKTTAFVVIIVTSISFLAFLTLRKIGSKGLAIVGALGGMINSEATTSELSSKAKVDYKLKNAAVLGIVASNTVMLVRNAVIAASIMLSAGLMMAKINLAIALVGVLYFLYIYLRVFKREHVEGIELKLPMPFAIMPAIKFGIIFTLISVFVNLATKHGVGSVYLTAFISGFVSSAAATASFISFAATGKIDVTSAVIASVIACLGSSLGKILISILNGDIDLGKRVAIPMVAKIIAGVLILFIVT